MVFSANPDELHLEDTIRTELSSIPRARAITLQVLREVALVVSAYFIYTIAKNLIHSNPSAEGFRNAWDTVSLEQNLGIFHEQSLQAWLMNSARSVVIFLN